MNRLDRAIEDFEDETLDLSLGERISNLRSALTWAAFERIKRIHKLGKKSEESEDLDFKQTECQKQFKIIDQMYNSQLRQNKMLGKAQDEGMDKEWLKKVKESTTLGSIVRNMNEKKDNDEKTA